MNEATPRLAPLLPRGRQSRTASIVTLASAAAIVVAALAGPANAAASAPEQSSATLGAACEWYGSVSLKATVKGSASGSGWSWTDKTTEETTFTSAPMNAKHQRGACIAKWELTWSGRFREKRDCANGAESWGRISSDGSGSGVGSMTASVVDAGNGTWAASFYGYGAEVVPLRETESKNCEGITTRSTDTFIRQAHLSPPPSDCASKMRVPGPNVQSFAGTCTVRRVGGEAIAEDTYTWSFRRADLEEEKTFRDRFCNAGTTIGVTVGGFSWSLGTTIHGSAKSAGKFGAAGLAISIPSAYCGWTAPKQPDEPTKPYMDTACKTLTGVSIGVGAAAVLNIWNPGGWVGGAVSLGTGLASTIPCAMDPPDPKFRTIPNATAAKIALPASPKGVSPRLTRATRSYFRNSALIAGVGQAMATCVNRASGAKEARQPIWERRQHACAADYAARLAKLYGTQKSLRRNLLAALKAEDIPNAKISRSRAVASLRKLPLSIRKGFTRAGATPAEIAFVQKRVAKASASVQTPSSLYAAVDSAKTRAALNSAARAFAQLSREYRSAARKPASRSTTTARSRLR